MLKHNITYEDFNGNTVTETFYFNLSKSELVEMQFDTEGGFAESLQKIVATQDSKALIAEFKKLILASYGEKSEDGKRFIKNDQLRDEFKQTAAYNALFVQLATDDSAAAAFIQGILPKDISEEVKTKAEAPALPPPPPAA